MKYLLDTDVFSEMARGRNSVLRERLLAIGTEEIALSVITEAEVRFGQACRPVAPALASRIEMLLTELPCLSVGRNVVAPYAMLRAALRRAGTPIGPNDCWIAAHALAENLTLVSGNQQEYRRVPGLRVENWLR